MYLAVVIDLAKHHFQNMAVLIYLLGGNLPCNLIVNGYLIGTFTASFAGKLYPYAVLGGRVPDRSPVGRAISSAGKPS